MKEYIFLFRAETVEKIGSYRTKSIEAEDRKQAVTIGKAYAEDHKTKLIEVWELAYREA